MQTIYLLIEMHGKAVRITNHLVGFLHTFLHNTALPAIPHFGMRGARKTHTHTQHFPACFYFSAARGGWSWRFVGHGAVHVAAANPPQTPQPPRTTAQHTRAFSAAPLLRILRPVQLKAEGALRGLLKQRTNFAVASLSLSSRPQWPAAHERERGQSTGVFKTRKLGIRYEQEL